MHRLWLLSTFCRTLGCLILLTRSRKLCYRTHHIEYAVILKFDSIILHIFIGVTSKVGSLKSSVWQCLRPSVSRRLWRQLFPLSDAMTPARILVTYIYIPRAKLTKARARIHLKLSHTVQTSWQMERQIMRQSNYPTAWYSPIQY